MDLYAGGFFLPSFGDVDVRTEYFLEDHTFVFEMSPKMP